MHSRIEFPQGKNTSTHLMLLSSSSTSTMPVVNSCCFKCSNRTGSIVIGALLFVFCLAFLGVCIGLVAGWDDFDTDFLDNTLSK